MVGTPGWAQRLSDSDFDLAAGLGNEDENGALREVIAAEIRALGSITFRRFMELALYHPIDGYYSAARGQIGRSGDYVTSPEISPLFGYALASQVVEFWNCLDRPQPFNIVEAGSGSGRLARDLLRWLRQNSPDCYDASSYTLVERSRPLRGAQADLLTQERERGKARVAPELPAQYLGSGCILANELLDALPVHRVTADHGRLREIYVDVDAGRFFERLDAPSTPDLEAYFDRLSLTLADGCVAEVCLETRPWLDACARALTRGYLLLLDYGYSAERKYAAWRRGGTLLCYHRHQATEDPYRFIGRQDITAHVDFTSVELEARAAGFERVGFTSQTRFLAALGIGISVRLAPSSEDAMHEYYSRRRAVGALLDPEGLGRISVMLLGRDAPACAFAGFASGPEPGA